MHYEAMAPFEALGTVLTLEVVEAVRREWRRREETFRLISRAFALESDDEAQSYYDARYGNQDTYPRAIAQTCGIFCDCRVVWPCPYLMREFGEARREP